MPHHEQVVAVVVHTEGRWGAEPGRVLQDLAHHLPGGRHAEHRVLSRVHHQHLATSAAADPQRPGQLQRRGASLLPPDRQTGRVSVDDVTFCADAREGVVRVVLVRDDEPAARQSREVERADEEGAAGRRVPGDGADDPAAVEVQQIHARGLVAARRHDASAVDRGQRRNAVVTLGSLHHVLHDHLRPVPDHPQHVQTPLAAHHGPPRRPQGSHAQGVGPEEEVVGSDGAVAVRVEVQPLDGAVVDVGQQEDPRHAAHARHERFFLLAPRRQIVDRHVLEFRRRCGTAGGATLGGGCRSRQTLTFC